MVTKSSLWGVIVGGVLSILILTVLLWWMFFHVSYIVYSQDTVIQGDFVVTEDQPVMLKDNAKITVKGDAILAGEVICKKGGIRLEVEGFLTMANEVNCDTDPNEAGVNASGVQIVASGGLLLGPTSTIDSMGSVQLVDQASKIATSQESVDQLFDAAENDDSSGLQIGPLTNDLADASYASPEQSVEDGTTSFLPFVQAAYAAEQEPEGGRAYVHNLVERITNQVGLTDDERDALALVLIGFSDSLIGRDDVSKNNERFRGVERYLDEAVRDFIKNGSEDLEITPEEAQAISEIIDDFLREEEGKLPVIVSGAIRVGDGGTPPEEIDVEELLEEELSDNEDEKKRPKKIILNFDFSDGKRGVVLSNLTVKGPHGVDAPSGRSSDCDVVGENGGDALRFTARAHNLRVGNVVLEMGHGGDGGSVASSPACEKASATGGNGGKPGNIRMRATGTFEVFGNFTIVPGIGGFGGGAKAETISMKAACPGEDAGLAEATGGNGGDSLQRLRIRGTIGGNSLIRVASAYGGDGGSAFAQAGNGGDGKTCGCAGGLGGKAIAVGGNGGAAAPAKDGSSIGGNGGKAIAVAGDGGHGAHCKKDEGPAGAGGNGGDAIMSPGIGGPGDTAGKDGSDGSEALAGDGGNGGDGCREGARGLAGLGNGGFNGTDGEQMCTNQPPEEEVDLISIQGVDPESMYEMEVIPFSGTAIPTFLVRVAGPDECDSDHWHGGGAITMIDGSTTTDPAPGGCGFGKRSELEPVNVRVNESTMKELYGNAVGQYLFYNDGTEGQTTNPGCSMIELCMTGGSWVTCPGQEDVIEKNTELGCPGY